MHTLKQIGDPKVKFYQRTVIISGITLVLLFIFIALITQNEEYKNYPILIFTFFTLLTFLYSKIYCVKYDSKYFYIENLFSKKQKQIDSSQFVRIQYLKHLDFLLMIVFNDHKFFIMTKSKDMFKNPFRSKDSFYQDLTRKIKTDILQEH